LTIARFSISLDGRLLGGLGTIQPLIERRGVDRLEVMLVPVLHGDGAPIAVDDELARDLRLTGTETHDDGVVQLTYEFR
jgi:dihydrofolate reductase